MTSLSSKFLQKNDSLHVHSISSLDIQYSPYIAFEAHRPEHRMSDCRGMRICKIVISEETGFSKCLGVESKFAIGLKGCFKKDVFAPNSVQTIAFSNLMGESQLKVRG